MWGKEGGRSGRVAAPTEPYDPIKAGSIDGTDTEPHDRAILRALEASYDPTRDAGIKGSARRTLFVGRLSLATNEDTLRATFERFGTVYNLRLVRDIVTGQSKGYAFVEYKHERDALDAYRDMHGRDIDNARILVDMERERSMKGWVPRRLGGGFGGKKESGQLRFGGRDRPWRQPIRPHMYSPDVQSSGERRHNREYQSYRSDRDAGYRTTTSKEKRSGECGYDDRQNERTYRQDSRRSRSKEAERKSERERERREHKRARHD